MPRLILLLLGALGVTAGPFRRAAGQLTLGDALREADHSAYRNRAATANTAAQLAQRLVPLAGILPSVRFEAGYLKTTDPIGVFGSTLRQRSVTPANFDPERLNYPGAVANYQGGIVLEQPLFNADAWTGHRAATLAASAGIAAEEWTRLSTRLDVVRAYYGAVVAAERAKTIETAAHAAHAHVAQAEAMVRQGLVTKSDALLASVRAGQVDADLAEAIGAAQTAQSELAVLLGRNGDPAAGLVPAQPLPSGDRIRAVVSADTAAQSAAPRADVQAASRGLDAARADRLRARSSFLPRLNAFARYDWNSAARLYTGDRNWTTGIMASWTPFAGARDVAEVQITNGRASAAQAQSEAAAANARLEAEQTRIALSVALTRLAIAEHAVAQSAEAHRIVAKKYDGGLATVVELLDAQATETQSALALLQTRWAAIVAGAERLRALGRDPASLEVFDQTTVAASTRDSAGEPP